MTLAALVLLLATGSSVEECLVTDGPAAVTAEYRGQTYPLRNETCRDEFLSDPERYSQLYDALLELHRAGAAAPPQQDSLVPS